MIFEKIFLFFAPLPFVFFVLFWFARLVDWFVATMSESGEVIVENLEEKLESCSLDHEVENPPNYKAKTFRVGDGNIIGKSVIQ